MSAIVDERYGEDGKATVEERIETARTLAQTLGSKVKGYGFRLNAVPSKKNDGRTYVTIFVNGKGGTNPGKIQVSEIGAPTFFGNDTDMAAADNFLAATEAAGVKLRIFTSND